MDIKLISAKDTVDDLLINERWVTSSDDELELYVTSILKEIQRNAIEVAVQRCSEEADADYNISDYIDAKPEVYVINSSILDCKQKLFEENNLI